MFIEIRYKIYIMDLGALGFCICFDPPLPTDPTHPQHQWEWVTAQPLCTSDYLNELYTTWAYQVTKQGKQ